MWKKKSRKIFIFPGKKWGKCFRQCCQNQSAQPQHTASAHTEGAGSPNREALVLPSVKKSPQRRKNSGRRVGHRISRICGMWESRGSPPTVRAAIQGTKSTHKSNEQQASSPSWKRSLHLHAPYPNGTTNVIFLFPPSSIQSYHPEQQLRSNADKGDLQ